MAEKGRGLKRGTVAVVSYKTSWKEDFQKEENNLLKLKNKHIKGIEHVGSTALPGMPAKPIIDIIVGVDSYRNVKKLKRHLVSIGFQFALEPRRYQSLFVKTLKGRDTHYLKVLRYRGKFWEKYIHFRNALLHNANYFKEYKNLKIKLAKEFAQDRKGYTKSKDALITKVLAS